jgi:hypothetical protein
LINFSGIENVNYGFLLQRSEFSGKRGMVPFGFCTFNAFVVGFALSVLSFVTEFFSPGCGKSFSAFEADVNFGLAPGKKMFRCRKRQEMNNSSEIFQKPYHFF